MTTLVSLTDNEVELVLLGVELAVRSRVLARNRCKEGTPKWVENEQHVKDICDVRNKIWRARNGQD
jgi:hypothetical protein